MADPSKTEPATSRRGEAAGRRGQVARSIEVNTAVGLLGVWGLLHFWGAYMLAEMAGICRFAWGNLGRFQLTLGEFKRYLWAFNLKFALLLLPLLLGVF